ncbi:MAG: SUMF1/EgtB/PvdO family nonheme iron enzyme [Candidatus Omnitrophica bacterium]|nr:SUMF1/EgtB/PvdO family nonheme iron enzyme [Candidatus Omnitrophota bacterium]MCB9783537.1 SUMF1/EgtB/PvdO family nonheme iron enzyme [Candidatus Omnitrophota bacterium]
MTDKNRLYARVFWSLAFLSLVIGLSFRGAAAEIVFAHPDAPAIERVRIPAGEFVMGSDQNDRNESPAHSVYLDDYEISTFEVTWEEYQAFIDAGGYEDVANNGFWTSKGASMAAFPYWSIDDVYGHTLTGPAWTPEGSGPPGFASRGHWPPKPNDPVIGISLWEAQAYCRFVGGRLPTEAEWEKAATWGPDATSASTFPWGEDASAPMPGNGFEVKEGFSTISEVDNPRYEGDVSRYGVRGMGGNVSEMVGDMFDPEFYSQGPSNGLPWENPFCFVAKRLDLIDEVGATLPLNWGIRGGHYGHNTVDAPYFRASRRDLAGVISRTHTVGFRVAWDAAPKPMPTPVVREDRPGAAVEIPTGSYLIGHTEGMPSEIGASKSESPQHPVCLNQFWIGKYEVTWYEYRKFIEMGGYGDVNGPKPEWWSDEGWAYRVSPSCSGGLAQYAVERPAFMGDPRPDFRDVLYVPTLWKGPWNEENGLTSPPDDHPVFGLSWFEAEAYCNFVGGRLPMEAEWEVAATWNPDKGLPTQYPWGNFNIFPYDSVLNNSGDDPKYPGFQSSPVGMYPEGKSHFGCYDMSGNVFEWCEDWASGESYKLHSSECGADLTTPDYLKEIPATWDPCEPDYWPVPGFKMTRGGGYDPTFFNAFAQRARTRGDTFDASQMFRNFTYGVRVVWDQDPDTIPEAQMVRPPYASGTDTPAVTQVASDFVPPPSEISQKVYPGDQTVILEASLETPGSAVWYRIYGPEGAMVEIDLDAQGGSDDPNGFTELDSVIEVWHPDIDQPVNYYDDEIIPTDDLNLRLYYYDPPVFKHRIPAWGYFDVKVRAYSWPAEGSQSGLSIAERSHNEPGYRYELNITAPGVSCGDPSEMKSHALGMVLDVIEGARKKSAGAIAKGDISGDGFVNSLDLFKLTAMWPTIETECEAVK